MALLCAWVSSMARAFTGAITDITLIQSNFLARVYPVRRKKPEISQAGTLYSIQQNTHNRGMGKLCLPNIRAFFWTTNKDADQLIVA